MMLAFQDGPSLAGKPATQPAPTTAAPGAPQGAAPAPPGMEQYLPFIGLMLAAMLVFNFVGSKRQRKQREKLFSDLKKHDRVVTTGGLIGFVSEVKPDVVVLKLEEGRDTRVTFTRDAIAAVVKAAPTESAAPAAEKTSA